MLADSKMQLPYRLLWVDGRVEIAYKSNVHSNGCKPQTNMKKQINIMFKRLFGKVTVYAKGSAILGKYSYGKRDIFGGDWDGEIKQN